MEESRLPALRAVRGGKIASRHRSDLCSLFPDQGEQNGRKTEQTCF
jgi:hypothetical protein